MNSSVERVAAQLRTARRDAADCQNRPAPFGCWSGELCRMFNSLSRFNPVATLWFLDILPAYNVFQDSTVLFDGPDRRDVVIIAGDKDAMYPEPFAGNLDRQL
jgi:hypothetical protein